MTTPINSAAAAASAASTTNTTTTNGLNQDFNTFLTLLTTQLQNQDPLSPLDTNQFTQQLVSFSGVEQQINTNKNLTQLISLQSASQTISSLPLVGQSIEYNEPTAPLAGGKATYVYTLPADASATTLTVKDANGKTVYSEKGETDAGTYVFNWDGKTSDGTQMPDGNYTLQVQAATANNTAITANIASIGTVAGVGVVDGQATFTIAGRSVPMSELVTINPVTN
jgi:flagellar basal-body rod modification protein FlgD